MQPTVPQSAGAADMDLPAVQSMDWLFKKERIYLLAQFWQQVNSLSINQQRKSSQFHKMSIVEQKKTSIFNWFLCACAIAQKWTRVLQQNNNSVKCKTVCVRAVRTFGMNELCSFSSMSMFSLTTDAETKKWREKSYGNDNIAKLLKFSWFFQKITYKPQKRSNKWPVITKIGLSSYFQFL